MLLLRVNDIFHHTVLFSVKYRLQDVFLSSSQIVELSKQNRYLFVSEVLFKTLCSKGNSKIKKSSASRLRQREALKLCDFPKIPDLLRIENGRSFFRVHVWKSAKVALCVWPFNFFDFHDLRVKNSKKYGTKSK